MTKLDINERFQEALDLLEHGESVFITGNAGTGKSTLLRYFLEHTDRRAVVAAPTGVAALNVGGQTIHRLFSFPSTVTPEFAMSKDYFPRRNHSVLRSIDTIVLDEISMVRADLLDAVDVALRRFGPKRGAPFGGIQAVFVGDPYQLPPVVTDGEIEHFRTRYATPYFFSADVFKTIPFHIVNLDKVYRQRDREFIDLLNAIRTGSADQTVFDRLNQRFKPDFEPLADEFWVTLTTTNRMADQVNDARLEGLPDPELVHVSASWGEVEDSDKPVPDLLRYKVGAQVMLVSNDAADRWINGSMGIVIGSEEVDHQTVVEVELLDGGKVTVEPYTWEITRPVIDEGRLSHEVVGSYTQLPVKLAWAVTIHKSQGRTLERVIVALGRGTFADGQLYVALSRATSLDGLVLKTEVKRHHVMVEREVTRFLARSEGHGEAIQGLGFIGIHATGVGRHDRMIELALVLDDGRGNRRELSTLLNPMRDIGRAEEHGGISASDLEFAPTFVEAWPLISRRLHGHVLVGHGLSLLQTMMEREGEAANIKLDLGLGYDTLAVDPRPLPEVMGEVDIGRSRGLTALDMARATATLFERLDTADLVVRPYAAEAAISGPGRILSRDPLALSLVGDGEAAYADLLSQVLSRIGQDVDPLRETCSQLASTLDLDAETVSRLHSQALELLVAAISRDGTASAVEVEALDWASSVLGLARPTLQTQVPTADSSTSFRPDLRVCFTGSASDLTGAVIERHDLEALAAQHGLIPVASVTKKGCDALIAADPSSMSGKAKKARDFGIPVLSVDSFLTWCTSR